MAILKKSYNEHDWAGGISTFKWEITDKITWLNGVDFRYYQGRHFETVDNLLGADYYVDGTPNRPNYSGQSKVGDIITYNNNFDIFWLGLFSQLEYKNDLISTFLTISGSDNFFKRTDFFDLANKITPWRSKLGVNTKAGIGFNIDAYNNIYANGGFFTRGAYVSSLYNKNQTYLSQVKNEKVYSGELGYGFEWQSLKIGINGYYTVWQDRSKSVNVRDNTLTYRGIIYGMLQQHYGLEMETSYAPWPYLQLSSSFSIGNWTYNNNPRANLNTDDGKNSKDFVFQLKGIKVADAAQMTAFLGIQSDIWKGLYVGLDANYIDQIYSDFSIDGNLTQTGFSTWRIPAFYTLDARIGWANIVLKNKWKMSVIGNVYNVTNQKYINEATDGLNHDQNTSRFFYGQNISYLVTLKFNFG